MSKETYSHGGLRTWDEREIEVRDYIVTAIYGTIKETLLFVNNAWIFKRIEGCILTPRDFVSNEYTDDDLFVTNHKDFVMRGETTPSSYFYAKNHIKNKMPFCVWQLGKSFRRELNDGATASKFRYNEFYQQEFQCIYSKTSRADYRDYILKSLPKFFSMFFGGSEIRIVDSDRLPAYSDSTKDIEVFVNDRWVEIASCSIRNDYSDDAYVCEIAVGIDRCIDIYNVFYFGG